MSAPALDDLPGFRRRFIVQPEPGQVRTAVEDDYHCMAVTLHHDGEVITRVEPDMRRAPWTTCPGAVARLVATFTGVALKDVPSRGEKQSNCTHLHDLAVLGAVHADDPGPSQFDILVSDPVDGRSDAELRKNDELVLAWTQEGHALAKPTELAGLSLFKLRPWIEALPAGQRDAARMLQWGAILAHGRTIPLEHQSDASRIPPNCYTFQPENAPYAIRVGEIIDFSDGKRQPLEECAGSVHPA